MRKLKTVKQALRWTRDMWAWLAAHPERMKHHWPGWLTRQRCMNDCALCEITPKHWMAHNRPDCSKCPLRELWTAGSSEAQVQEVLSNPHGYLCSCLENSPYYVPPLFNRTGKLEAALKISRAAGAALRKL